ncbi:MAG TPA: hypothetical protein VF952_20295 [Chloroflexia bacterium]|jgi:hypothetical protein
MRVKVISSGHKLSEGTEVTFNTEYGVGKGLWVGEVPNFRSTRDVELDVQEELIWGDTIVEVPSPEFAVSEQGGRTILQGMIESADANEVCVLRIGNSILLIHVTGSCPSPGMFVSVSTGCVLLYDTNL